MTQEKLKCINCGRILENNDEVFVVKTIRQDGLEYDSPTCCQECATSVKRKSIQYLENIITKLKKSEIIQSNVYQYSQM